MISLVLSLYLFAGALSGIIILAMIKSRAGKEQDKRKKNILNALFEDNQTTSLVFILLVALWPLSVYWCIEGFVNKYFVKK
jgi:hypothetical protein